MEATPDSIRTTVFAFNYEGKKVASCCNDIIEATFDSQIVPQIEKAISKIIPDGLDVNFSKLEIDIGKINEKDLVKGLAHKIRKSLEIALLDKLSIKKSPTTGNTPKESTNLNGFLLEALEIFLLKGYFPSRFNRELTFGQLVTKLFDEAQNDLMKLLKKNKGNEAAMARLRHNLDSKTFEKIRPVLKLISLGAKQQLSIKDNQLSAEDLEIFLQKGYLPSWVYKELTFEQVLTRLLDESQDDKIQRLREHMNKKDIIRHLERFRVDFDSKSFEKMRPVIKPISLEVTQQLPTQDNQLMKEEMEGTEIRIYNSGIILFWPFLTHFFEQLALLNEGEFVDRESRNKAVYLLQYLGFSQFDYPEYELVLNKILVGMPIQNHLTPIESLSLEETDMATSLMNGLIQNWPKVKDSSIEAIQETFLQREGILSLNEENNMLTISKKGVDVLLTSIPWNITLVKLPWMEKPLHIEWI